MLPVRLLEAGAGGVGGGDAGLEVVLRHLVPLRGAEEVRQAPAQQALVPQGAVLIRQQQQVAVAVYPHRQARREQQKHGREGVDLGAVRGWMVGKQLHQPGCFGAEVFAHEILARVRRVPFVEHEVEDLQDGVEPLAVLRGLGDGELEPQLPDAPLGADQSLGDGRFFGQKGAGDLRNAEAAHGLQRQGHPRRLRQLRMAACEDHRQLLVRKRRRVGGFRPRLELLQAAADALLEPPQRGPAAQPVQRLVARYVDQPGPRVLGDSAVRPLPQRLQERFLDHVFGEVQVLQPEDVGQGGQHLPRLAAEQMLDQLPNLRAGLGLIPHRSPWGPSRGCG